MFVERRDDGGAKLRRHAHGPQAFVAISIVAQ
jgi:hypothetical protein